MITQFVCKIRSLPLLVGQQIRQNISHQLALEVLTRDSSVALLNLQTQQFALLYVLLHSAMKEEHARCELLIGLDEQVVLSSPILLDFCRDAL